MSQQYIYIQYVAYDTFCCVCFIYVYPRVSIIRLARFHAESAYEHHYYRVTFEVLSQSNHNFLANCHYFSFISAFLKEVMQRKRKRFQPRQMKYY